MQYAFERLSALCKNDRKMFNLKAIREVLRNIVYKRAIVYKRVMINVLACSLKKINKPICLIINSPIIVVYDPQQYNNIEMNKTVEQIYISKLSSA